jgi:hypothetical protein
MDEVFFRGNGFTFHEITDLRAVRSREVGGAGAGLSGGRRISGSAQGVWSWAVGAGMAKMFHVKHLRGLFAEKSFIPFG